MGDIVAGITIRPEVEDDRLVIRKLIVEVFAQTFGTGVAEADLVEQLRTITERGPCISLVATHETKLIGHVFYSPVKLVDHPAASVFSLGPVGVYRDWQKKGIGSKLIRDGLKLCGNARAQAVFTTGNIGYYSRFGFVPLGGSNLHTLFNTEHDMVLESEPGFLKRVSGLVDYPKPWHVFHNKP